MLLEADPTTQEYQVNIGWKLLDYTEDGQEGSIRIYIDPPTRYGMPFAFYVPGENRWREVMPEWAADRRAEIVTRIKEECSHYHAEWVEGLTFGGDRMRGAHLAVILLTADHRVGFPSTP